VFDVSLRTKSHAALTPLALRFRGTSPAVLTLAGGAVGLASAGAAGAGWWIAAVALWLSNRVLDGFDGIVARADGTASDAGGYLDMTVDVLVYATVPLGVAVGLGTVEAWVAVAVLQATFFFNTITWSYLSAVLEKRQAGAASTGESTSVTMPAGLVEGAETIVLFTLILLAPLISSGLSIGLMWAMAVLVSVGAVVRTRHGMGVLR